MTAKVFSVICHVIAGFVFYMILIMGFTMVRPVPMKAGMMLGFLVPALGALLVGFALNGFRRKLRDLGIVLLSAAGFTAFVVFTFACLWTDDEFRRMMKPETMAFFEDYGTGFGCLAATAVIGLLSLRLGIKKPIHPPETENADKSDDLPPDDTGPQP